MPDNSEPPGKPQEWFIVGERDLQTARIAFNAGAPTGSTAVLIHQSVEKSLKGYLISKGWSLKKTHDLEVLVSEAIRHDKAFEQYLDFARTVSAYYLEDRYPPLRQEEYPRKEIAGILEQAGSLINMIKKTGHPK